MNKDSVRIYTDGACQGNPGPGGWAALLILGDRERMISGYEQDTTNNRMEMQAAISALQALKGTQSADLWTDSQYLRLGITTWVHQWKKNNWKNSQKKPVKNKDLWQTLVDEAAKHHVRWHWVKGHSGDVYNERVDEAARMAIEKML